MSKCDVLVVGAGPAGSSAAFFTKLFDKENDFDVILLERLNEEKYLRYHDMCGEGVSERLFLDISPIKADFIMEKIKKQRQHWPDGIVIETQSRGYIIERTNFFKDISKQFIDLGGRHIESSLVDFQVHEKIKVGLANGEFIETKYLVAADGANSYIRRKFQIEGRTFPLIQYIIDKRAEQGTIVFEFDEKWKGNYKWTFPHGGNTKIGFPYIKNSEKVDGKIIAKQSRMVGFGGIGNYVHGNVLLVGDAACQTNPITKGGIRPGMIAGKMAARAIVDGTPEKYDREWKSSGISSHLFLKAHEQLKKMDNKELAKHVEPFTGGANRLTPIKLILFYRKYLDMYNAYKLSDEVGW